MNPLRSLKPRKLLILRSARNARIATSAELRYTAGTQGLNSESNFPVFAPLSRRPQMACGKAPYVRRHQGVRHSELEVNPCE